MLRHYYRWDARTILLRSTFKDPQNKVQTRLILLNFHPWIRFLGLQESRALIPNGFSLEEYEEELATNYERKSDEESDEESDKESDEMSMMKRVMRVKKEVKNRMMKNKVQHTLNGARTQWFKEEPAYWLRIGKGFCMRE